MLPLHPVNRGHLDALSDAIGVMQHAIGSRPDPAHGYCTDDVARALQVDLLHQRSLGWSAVSETAWRNVRFLANALDHSTRRFRNFRRADGTWLEATGSEDSQGRAMLALAETMVLAPDGRLAVTAERLFFEALPATPGLRALRARSSLLLACHVAQQASPSRDAALAFRALAGRLRSTFGSSPPSEWPWPEQRLTYENALPVRALLVAGRFLGSRQTIEAGLQLVDWLVAAQTAPAGHLSPVGNGWWSRGGPRSQFDQQPIEATALLLAAETALELTDDPAYGVAIELAYGWFLGANDRGLAVAAPERGASHDGLTATGVNANQGAESTLMWLMALEHVRARRGAQPAPPSPSPMVLAAAG